MNGIAKQFNRLLLTAICLTVLILSGCSKKEEEESKSDESVFRFLLPTKIGTLDPGNIQDVYGNWVAAQICEPLYTYHYLKRPFVLEPVLADGMPIVSEDKLTYTIPIKKGIYFQDDPCFPEGKGREVKAQDFVFGLKRISNIRYASVNWGGLKERIVGLDEFREYTKQFKDEFSVDYSKEVEGVKAIDDYTLQFKLIKPWPQFVDGLTGVASAPMPKEAVDYYRKDMIFHPIGTGPYYLKTWSKSVYIELEINPTYHLDLYPSQGAPGDQEAGLLADAGKQMPFIDRIIFRIIEEEQPAWLLFMRGDLDMMGIPKDNFSSAVDIAIQRPTEQIQQRNIKLSITDQPSLYYYGFNMRDPVLGKNKPLREALCRAVDRKKLNEMFYNDRWRVAHSIIHPLMNEYDPNIINQNYMRYDPQEAKRLIVEAEKIQGGPIPELVIGSVGGSTFLRQFGQFIEREIGKVGLKVRSDYTDWPTYIDKMNKGQLQILGGGGVRFGTPDGFGVLSMFATKYFAPLGNSFFYSNPEYDRLYEQAEVMFPGPERTEIYRKMEWIVLEDYPAIFTNHRVQYELLHGWIQNHKPHPFLYDFMKYLRIDTEQKKEYKTLLKELKQKNPNP